MSGGAESGEAGQLEVWRQMVARAKKTTGTVHWTEFGKLLEAYEVERKRARVGTAIAETFAEARSGMDGIAADFVAILPPSPSTSIIHEWTVPTPLSRVSDGKTHPLGTIDTVTPEAWRAASEAERRGFHRFWNSRGEASFQCLTCGYPTVYGQGSCEACRPQYPTPAERETTAQAEDQVEGPVSPEVAAGGELAGVPVIEAPKPKPSIMSPDHADKFKLPKRKREDRASAFNLYSRVQREKGITDLKVIAAQWHAMKKDQSEPMGEP